MGLQHSACGILVPQPGMKPRVTAVRALSPSYCSTREVPGTYILGAVNIFQYISCCSHWLLLLLRWYMLSGCIIQFLINPILPLSCHHLFSSISLGFPGGSDGKVSACNAGDMDGFDPWVRKIPWRRKWQSTPGLLPGKFHGWTSLAGYSPWGRKELRHD